ncbi:hypothetical protein Sxan_03270 [Streptomyces xanthophaeus]|uniref:Uncharacterized protein n=1 Tax=Streptomyces xanthophaeus TaxID=67385 RepID=A0A919GRL4_9ACTN|nr:hypothetical protein Sxan_03270 [Streptomyces xanthophaeus]
MGGDTGHVRDRYMSMVAADFQRRVSGEPVVIQQAPSAPLRRATGHIAAGSEGVHRYGYFV